MTGMATTTDFYQLLGVSRGATDEQIRSAYRKLARQLHPDVNKEPDAAQRFKEITEAYEILTDARRRSAHGDRDRSPRCGPGARARGDGAAARDLRAVQGIGRRAGVLDIDLPDLQRPG